LVGRNDVRGVPLDRASAEVEAKVEVEVAHKVDVGSYAIEGDVLVDAAGAYWLETRWGCLRTTAGESTCTKGRAETRIIRAPLTF
jgi:hypothetical protein